MNPEKDIPSPRTRQALHVRPASRPAWARVAPLLVVATLCSGLAAADETGAASGSVPASASGLSEAERDRQAEAISRSIMSPFCPGRTVSACPNAGPWRDDIRKWVGEGVEAAEIKRRLAERVPEHNLSGIPKNRLGWMLPVGAAVGALGFLVFLLRYLIGPRGAGNDKTPAPGSTSPKASNASAARKSSEAPAPAKDWDARLDEELETLER